MAKKRNWTTIVNCISGASKEVRLWATDVGVPVYGIMELKKAITGESGQAIRVTREKRYSSRKSVKSKLDELEELLMQVKEQKQGEPVPVLNKADLYTEEQKAYIQEQFEKEKAHLEALEQQARQL